MFAHLFTSGTRRVQTMHAVNEKPFQPQNISGVIYKHSIGDYGMGTMCPLPLLSSFCANCTLGPVQHYVGGGDDDSPFSQESQCPHPSLKVAWRHLWAPSGLQMENASTTGLPSRHAASAFPTAFSIQGTKEESLQVLAPWDHLTHWDTNTG